MNPWVIGGLVALGAWVLLAPGTASAATSSGGNYWPPTSADQAALTQQIQMYGGNAVLGASPSASDQAAFNAEVAGLIAQAPQAYIDSLGGQMPSVAGYRTWVMSVYITALQGMTPGGNPYIDPNYPSTAMASGPMWAYPHARQVEPITSGTGLGWG